MNRSKSDHYCTFYIVRHGETIWNVEKLIQGHGDSPLTSLGKMQAENIARELKDIKFDKIYSSDLLRAKKTAEIIALEHKLVVETTKLLRERSWGNFEGKSQKLFKKFNKVIDELTRAERFTHKVSPEVESDEEITSRLITFLREVAVSNPHKTILVTTHGGIMKAFLIHIGFASYENFRKHFIANTGYIKLKSDGVDFFIEKTKGVEKPA